MGANGRAQRRLRRAAAGGGQALPVVEQARTVRARVAGLGYEEWGRARGALEGLWRVEAERYGDGVELDVRIGEPGAGGGRAVARLPPVRTLRRGVEWADVGSGSGPGEWGAASFARFHLRHSSEARVRGAGGAGGGVWRRSSGSSRAWAGLLARALPLRPAPRRRAGQAPARSVRRHARRRTGA